MILQIKQEFKQQFLLGHMWNNKSIKISKMKNKSKTGSILIGSLLIMLMLASIAIAVVSRDKEGALMAIGVERGNVVYQDADRAIDGGLNAFRELDESTDGKIPENTLVNVSASDPCDGYECSGFIGSPNYASDVSIIKGGKLNNDLARLIETPLPPRINYQGFSNFKVVSCANDPGHCVGANDGTYSYNKCDARVSFKWDAQGLNETEKIKNAAEGFQIRQSKENSSINEGYWYNSSDIILPDTDSGLSLEKSIVIENDVASTHIQDTAEKTYYYAIKAKNKNPLTLDSLYYKTPANGNDIKLEVPEQSCSSSLNKLGNNGCAATNQKPLLGVQIYNQAYTCCGGTDCYMPSPDWEATNNNACVYEKCLPADVTVGIYNSSNDTGGDAMTGWCKSGKTVPCQNGLSSAVCSGNTCIGCQKTKSYCEQEPTPSKQSNFFNNSNWVLGNNENVYTGTNYTSSSATKMKYRCAYHEKPTALKSNSESNCGAISSGSWTATLVSSEEKACGPYSAAIKCTLSCNSEYQHLTGNKDDIVTNYDNGAQLKISYNDKKNNCAPNLCGSKPDHTNWHDGDNVNVKSVDEGKSYYSTTDTPNNQCEFKCASEYVWDSNTKSCYKNSTTTNTCGIKPGHTTWYPNDDSSIPDQDAGNAYHSDQNHYNTKCEFYCNDPWYPEWDGSKCYLPWGQCPAGYEWDSSSDECI
jgi:hypothetical protein